MKERIKINFIHRNIMLSFERKVGIKAKYKESNETYTDKLKYGDTESNETYTNKLKYGDKESNETYTNKLQYGDKESNET